jgi:DNA-directed RNA polymerase specialized sigma24 family protein
VDDEWLVDQCLEGETAYWNVLVRRYRDQLLEKVSVVVKNPEDAREVVEEALLQARMRLASFQKYLDFRNADAQGQPRTKQRPLFFSWLCTFTVEPTLSRIRGK